MTVSVRFRHGLEGARCHGAQDHGNVELSGGTCRRELTVSVNDPVNTDGRKQEGRRIFDAK